MDNKIRTITKPRGKNTIITIAEKIISNKYEDFSQTNLVFKHDKLSKKDLSNMISKSYRDYYLRTDYFFKIFKNIFKKLSVTS